MSDGRHREGSGWKTTTYEDWARPPESHNENGIKDLKGKPQVKLIPYEAIKGMAEVRKFGNEKYKEPWRWYEEGNRDDFVEAGIRHLYKHLSGDYGGDRLDDESGLSHLKHALTSIAMAVALDEKEKK